jgi:hypothetical protein
MFEGVNRDRRRFLRGAVVAVASAELLMRRSAEAQTSGGGPSRPPAIGPGASSLLASLKQVDAGVLNVGYAEVGPDNGPVVILLHGWPYDIHSFIDVAPLLASTGYRVIVPFGCPHLGSIAAPIEHVGA